MEILKILTPNELARLNCARACSKTMACMGFEAASLIKLRLAETDRDGSLSITSLGQEVQSLARRHPDLAHALKQETSANP
ncbi:hypothetical protein [Yoonia tamlensis]|uniref:hypothetical protein n=1 Tax=Yoonia tamlensis TaxID=390270 RepID=UPI00104248E5|nr:hypothetical protein [Yoonia tamlensis]